MKENKLERLVRLAELRYENKLSQEKIAELLNITRPQYTLYETGQREMKASQIITLCKALNITSEDISKKIKANNTEVEKVFLMTLERYDNICLIKKGVQK